MEKKEIGVDSRLQSNLNSLIENTLEEDKKMEEDLSFFFSDKLCQPRKKNVTKKIKSYNTTTIKSRNFSSNIFYNGVKEEDLLDRNFVFDVYRLFKMFINVKNGKIVIYPHVAEIVWKYTEENENFHKLEQNNKKIFQFVYATLKFILLKFYTCVEKRELDLRNNFHLKFKEWKDKKYFIREQQMNVFLKKRHHQRQFKTNL